MKTETKAIFALFAVTIAWGLTFPLIKASSNEISSGLFVALRFLISATIFLPMIIKEKIHHTYRLFKIAITFGSLEGASYLFQTIGLKTIDSSESAFITAFSVVLIPFLSPLFKLDKIRSNGIIASIICLLGIFILSGASFSNIKAGCIWTLGCATAYALSVVYLSYEMRRFDSDKIVLNNTRILVFLQILFGIPIPLVSTAVDKNILTFSPIVIVALLFCAASTIFCYLIQTNYQKKINMNKVAVIYAFEPIFATFFGRVINGEAIYLHTILGGSLVIISFLIIELF
jgi:drug/metabolite transporter (DMT)-like permease